MDWGIVIVTGIVGNDWLLFLLNIRSALTPTAGKICKPQYQISVTKVISYFPTYGRQK